MSAASFIHLARIVASLGFRCFRHPTSRCQSLFRAPHRHPRILPPSRLHHRRHINIEHQQSCAAPTRAECPEIHRHSSAGNPIHCPTLRNTAVMTCAVNGYPTPSRPRVGRQLLRANVSAYKFQSFSTRCQQLMSKSTTSFLGFYAQAHEFSDPQIASRFEQMELPIWTESDELRRFVAGYLAMLPIRKNPAAIDQRFIEYVLALTDGVTGRIVDLLRRAAVDALGHKSKSVGIDQPIDGRRTPPSDHQPANRISDLGPR